jgi:hypothetical protein
VGRPIRASAEFRDAVLTFLSTALGAAACCAASAAPRRFGLQNAVGGVPHDVDDLVAAPPGPLGPEGRQQPQHAGADQGLGHALPERNPGQAFEILAQAVTTVGVTNSNKEWATARVPQVTLPVSLPSAPSLTSLRAARIVSQRIPGRQSLS